MKKKPGAAGPGNSAKLGYSAPMSEPVSEFPPLLDRIEQVIEQHHRAIGDPIEPDALGSLIHSEVTAGADFEHPRIQGAEMTPAQALAWLFDLPQDQRVRRMTELLDAHERAGRCFLMDHEGLQVQLDEARRLAITYRTALGELTQYDLGNDINLIIRTALAA